MSDQDDDVIRGEIYFDEAEMMALLHRLDERTEQMDAKIDTQTELSSSNKETIARLKAMVSILFAMILGAYGAIVTKLVNAF